MENVHSTQTYSGSSISIRDRDEILLFTFESSKLVVIQWQLRERWLRN